jgi:hypothetical protein
VQPSLRGVRFGSTGEALPNGVVICLSMLIGRLEKCQLEDVLRLTTNFRHFTRASTMSVSGITATNLEFFNNQVLRWPRLLQSAFCAIMALTFLSALSRVRSRCALNRTTDSTRAACTG